MNNDNLTYYIDLPRKRLTKAEKLEAAKKWLARAKAEYARAKAAVAKLDPKPPRRRLKPWELNGWV